MRNPLGSREEFVVAASIAALCGLGGKNQHAKLAAAEAVERANALANLLGLKTEEEVATPEAPKTPQDLSKAPSGGSSASDASTVKPGGEDGQARAVHKKPSRE